MSKKIFDEWLKQYKELHVVVYKRDLEMRKLEPNVDKYYRDTMEQMRRQFWKLYKHCAPMAPANVASALDTHAENLDNAVSQSEQNSNWDLMAALANQQEEN